jgi:hypothetical protein
VEKALYMSVIPVKTGIQDQKKKTGFLMVTLIPHGRDYDRYPIHLPVSSMGQALNSSLLAALSACIAQRGRNHTKPVTVSFPF